MVKEKPSSRVINAVHAHKKIEPDPSFELELSAQLKSQHSQEELVTLYGKFATGLSKFDEMMRRVLWRSLCKQFGNGVSIAEAVGFKHIERFEIGDGVFVGVQTYIQGRHDGRCVIGNHVWIGPQSYFDARDLEIHEYVGWGPGAKVLGSAHTGVPKDVPILKTDLIIKPVKIEAWADIGTGAIILPGVTVGKGSIVGAGAVVTEDVEPFAVVAGVPARFLHWREELE